MGVIVDSSSGRKLLLVKVQILPFFSSFSFVGTHSAEEKLFLIWSICLKNLESIFNIP